MIAYINLLTCVSDISWFQLLSCEVHYILIISLGFGLLVPLKQLTEKKKTTLRKFDYENNPLEAALKKSHVQKYFKLFKDLLLWLLSNM